MIQIMEAHAMRQRNSILTKKERLNKLLGQENKGSINVKKSQACFSCSGEVAQTTMNKTPMLGPYSYLTQADQGAARLNSMVCSCLGG
jgi:hypothetical protein